MVGSRNRLASARSVSAFFGAAESVFGTAQYTKRTALSPRFAPSPRALRLLPALCAISPPFVRPSLRATLFLCRSFLARKRVRIFIFGFLSEFLVLNRSTDVNEDFMKKSCRRNLDRHLRQRSRGLRNEATVAEKILWEALRKDACGGYRFLRQHPIPPYVVDFYCAALKLVIEVDGSIHDLPEVQANDQLRQNTLEERGLHLLRITNQEGNRLGLA